MKKRLGWLCVLIAVFTVGLVGCGDIYAGLKVSVDKNEIVLALDPTNEQAASAEFEATVEGAGDGVSTMVEFQFSNPGIASAQVAESSGNVNVVRVTALGKGETELTVITQEGNKRSAPILVRVDIPVSEIAFNESTPSVAVGETLRLNADDLMLFTPSNTSERGMQYRVLTPEDTYFNQNYSLVVPEGIEISEDGILSAAETATTGIIQILATSAAINEETTPEEAEKLTTVVYVMVYQKFGPEDITVMTGDVITNSITLAGNHADMSSADFVVSVDTLQPYTVGVVSNNINVASVSKIEAQDFAFRAGIVDTGETTFTVSAYLSDPVSGKVYVSVSRTLEIDVIKIVREVRLSSTNVAPSAEPITVNVFDAYVSGSNGTEVVVSMTPVDAVSTQFTFAVTAIDGSTTFADGAQNEVIVRDSLGREIKPGVLCKNGTVLYISLADPAGDERKITRDFVLTFYANVQYQGLPEVTNSVVCNLKSGVTAITSNVDPITVTIGESSDFSFVYGTQGGFSGVQTFDVSVSDENIARVTETAVERTYTVTGVNEGSTYITIVAENGFTKEIEVRVYVQLTEMSVKAPNERDNPNVASVVYKEPVQDASQITDAGVSHVMLKYLGSFDITLERKPEQATVRDVQYTSTDISIAMVDINGRVSAISTGNVTITVAYTYYVKVSENLWEEYQGERQFEVDVFRPVTDFYWETTYGESKEISIELYDGNSINFDKQDLSLADLFATVTPLRATYNVVDWQIFGDEALISLQEGVSANNVIVSAHIPRTADYTQDSYKVTLVGVISEFSKTFTVTCNIRIVRPVTVDANETIISGYNDFNGIYLESTGSEARSKFEINAFVQPTNAFDTRLEYFIFNAEKVDGKVVATTRFEEGQGTQVVRLETINGVPTLVAASPGFAVVRIVPKDRINAADFDPTTAEHYKDIWIEVADGSVVRPYRIFDSSDLLGMRSDKNYALMQDIDLSAITNFTPICGSAGFNAMLTSYGYELWGNAYTISGLHMSNASLLVENTNVYGGLFAKLGASAQVIGVNVFVSSFNIDLSAFAGKTVNLGVVAGLNQGIVTDSEITLGGITGGNKINVTGACGELNFGIVAGRNMGEIRYVAVNSATSIDSATTNTYIGGVTGYNGGIVSGLLNDAAADERLAINNVIQVLGGDAAFDKNSRAVGGVVGFNADTARVAYMHSMGSITYSGSGVGGVAGVNAGSISYSTSSAFITASGVVGGVAGYNSGAISNSEYEIYNSPNYNNILNSALNATQDVGGLVGTDEGGKISYSFVMSYVDNRNLVAQGTQLDSTNYYGDIVGESFVGGLIGRATDTKIISSFALCAVNAVDGTVGGFIGKYTLTSNDVSKVGISNAFANGHVLNTTPVSSVGEFVGDFTAPVGNYKFIDSVYARVYVIRNALNVYNFFGNTTGDGYINNSYYLAETAETQNGAQGRILTDLQNDGSNNTYTGWGFATVADNLNGTVAEWVKHSDRTGINDELPILFSNKPGVMLYNRAIDHLSVVEYKTLKESSRLLPTYFPFDDGTGVKGMIVTLDNLYTDTGYKSINISDLIELGVQPALDPSEWMLEITSSNQQIIRVIQPKQTLDGARLEAIRPGTAVITIKALRNTQAFVQIEICVVGGFSEFDLLDGDNDMKIAGQDMNVKLGYAKKLLPYIKSSHNFADSMGMIYTTDEQDYAGFTGYEWINHKVDISVNNSVHMLRADMATLELPFGKISIGALPYINVEFKGIVYKWTLDELDQAFGVRIYRGISETGLSSTNAVISSSETLPLTVNVFTDNTAVTEGVVETTVTVKSGADQISADDLSNLLQPLGSGVSVDPNKGIKFDYILELGTKYLNSNVVFDVKFDIYDIIDTQRIRFTTYNFELTVTPTQITRIDMEHYINGSRALIQGEAPSQEISPGTKGLLKLQVTPDYGYFDYLEIRSTVDPVSQDSISLSQSVRNADAITGIPGGSEYTADGALILRKVSDVTGGTQTFNGTLYVATLLSTGIAEGTPFTLTVRAVKEDSGRDYEFIPVSLTLKTRFTPYATLNLRSDNGKNIVARGTEAVFDLKGVALNSDVTLRASYQGTDSNLSGCYFDTLSAAGYEFNSGTKQDINQAVYFYVGLNAAPTAGIIDIILNVRSRSDTGGFTEIERTYQIVVVDYMVTGLEVQDASNGTFRADIRSYTAMKLKFNILTPSITTLSKYVPVDDLMTRKFQEGLDSIETLSSAQLDALNKWGDGLGGIWAYYNGSEYTSLSSLSHYPQFTVGYVDNMYYTIKGISLQTGIKMQASAFGYYVFDAGRNCYSANFGLSQENAPSERLENGDTGLVADFNMDIVNLSTDENPYPISTVDEFVNMQAGAAYILTRDITLNNFTPLNVDIASLDGNGHIIYLNGLTPVRGDPSQGTVTQNIGIFGTINSGTILKNLIVDVSRTVWVDAQNANIVNFGFIAGVNNGGVIYNCEVVVTENQSNWLKIYDESTQISSPSTQFARDIFNQIQQDYYTKNHTVASTFLLTSTLVNNNAVTVNAGGLVGQNVSVINNNVSAGAISNSRVGRVSNTALGYTKELGAPVVAKQGINIFAAGNVGGLVGYNNGVISSSYYANGYVVNTHNSATNTKTGGLVAEQDTRGRIYASYSLGMQNSILTTALAGDNGTQGRTVTGGIVSYGTIGGLVHTNKGIIQNSYANIPITSSSAVGGFVYRNLGTTSLIEHCYSLSTVREDSRINGIFTGLDGEFNILDEYGTIKNSYYLQNTNVIVDENEPAKMLTWEEWMDPDGTYFEGFVFSNPIVDNPTTWILPGLSGYEAPMLVQADKITVSYRDALFNYDIGNKLGTENNPFIIASISDFTKIFNLGSGYIDSERAFGSGVTQRYVRIVNDLDFSQFTPEETAKIIMAGDLQGNGMYIQNFNFAALSSSTNLSDTLGLFKEINGGTVAGLTINISSELSSGLAARVGALAGTITDSVVENIHITGNVGARIVGHNLVGALAGVVEGNTQLSNIDSSVSVYATYQTPDNAELKYYDKSLHAQDTGWFRISYAGGIAGVVSLEVNANLADNPTISNCYVYGNAEILAEIAGGVFGLVDTGSAVYKIDFRVQNDGQNAQHIWGSNFAGGIAGENRGLIMGSRVGEEQTIQIEKDQGILSTGNSQDYLGNVNIFETSETNASTNAIGGIVGLSIGGTIKNSYSRIAVMSNTAKAAGGIVGLSINAANSGFLKDLLKNTTMFMTQEQLALAGFTELGVELDSNGNPYSLGEDYEFGYSSTLDEVYTTSPVKAQIASGGVVGIVLGAPINSVFVNENIVALNNHPQSLIDQLASTQTHYVGSVAGFVGYNSDVTRTFVFVTDTVDRALSAQNVVAVTIPYNNALVRINEIGNKESNETYSQLNGEFDNINFITAATDSNSQPFNSFSTSIWKIDTGRDSNIFPIHTFGKMTTVQQIDSVNKLFESLYRNPEGYYRITRDIRITGTDWENLQNSYYRSSLAENASKPISGQIEGVVETGLNAPRATITLTGFTNAQKAEFKSLFGFTDNLTLLNLVFNFEDNYSISGLTNFGLLVQRATGTTFRNVDVNMKDGTSVQPLGVNNVGGIVGYGTSCSYYNVKTKVNIESTAFAPTTGASVGGMFGYADGTTRVSGAELGNVKIKLTSTGTARLSVGTVGGYSVGRISLTGANTGAANIAGSIEVSCTQNTVHVGGAVGSAALGNANNSVINLTTDVNIKITRNNAGVNTIHVGGIFGEAYNAAMRYGAAWGDINVTSAGSTVYAGGVVGELNNDLMFTVRGNNSNFDGYTVQSLQTTGDININSSASSVYVGGMFGKAFNKITMGAGNMPVGEIREVYSALISSGKINVASDSAADKIAYVGGIAGNLSQKLSTQSEELTTNNIVRLNKSAFMGDISVTDFDSVYSGGIAGSTSVAVSDTASYGDIAYNGRASDKLYMGGLVGLLKNTLSYSITSSSVSVNVQNRSSTEIMRYVSASVGMLYRNTITLNAVYFSGEMSGTGSQHGVNISAMNALDKSYLIGPIGTQLSSENWGYAETEEFSLPYPKMLKDYINLSAGGRIVPMVADSYTALYSLLSSAEMPDKIVLINTASGHIDLATLPQLSTANVSKILGAGTTFNFGSVNTGIVNSQNLGLFNEIDAGVVVSGLMLNIPRLTVQAQGVTNIAILAAINNGLIYNCSVGSVPQDPVNYGSVAQFSNGLADVRFSANINQYVTSDLTTIYYTLYNNSTVNAGALCAVNHGSIENSSSLADVICNSNLVPNYTNYMGGLIGSSTGGAIKDCYAQGRVVISDIADMSEGQGSYVGGMVGNLTDSYATNLISNVNLISAGSGIIGQRMGLAFGKATNAGYVSIVVNSDMSSKHLLSEFNTYFNMKVNMKEMSAPATMINKLKASENANKFDVVNTWAMNSHLNYGMPYLARGYQELNTGDGTEDSPFRIMEASQLSFLGVNAKYRLTRDLYVSSAYKGLQTVTVIGQLNGQGKRIYVDGYNVNSGGSTTYVGLFREVGTYGVLENFSVVAGMQSLNLSTSVQFGGVAITNKGTIRNVSAQSNGFIAFLSSTRDTKAGGLVGTNSGVITRCWADVNLRVNLGTVGGLVGVHSTPKEMPTNIITQSFALGDLVGNATSAGTKIMGGLVGTVSLPENSTVAVRDCYTYAEVLVAENGWQVGGLIGSSPTLSALRCYVNANYEGVSTTVEDYLFGNRVSGRTPNSVAIIFDGRDYLPRNMNSYTSPVDTLVSARNALFGADKDYFYNGWEREMGVWDRGTLTFGGPALPFLTDVTPEDRQDKDGNVFTD